MSYFRSLASSGTVAPFNPLATLAVGGNVSGEGEEISAPSLCCAISMSAEAPASTSLPFPEAK